MAERPEPGIRRLVPAGTHPLVPVGIHRLAHPAEGRARLENGRLHREGQRRLTTRD